MSDSEQCSNRLELDLISLLVNFSYELGQIMARFVFLWPRWVNLNNVQTDSQLDLISILVNFSCELGQIGGSFQKKSKVGPKNLIRFYIALNLGESSSVIFGQFPVARKLIINGGAIRSTGLLFFTFNYFLPLFPLFPTFANFSHFSHLTPLFSHFSHFFLLLTTFSHFFPLFPTFPTFCHFPTFSHF